MRKSYKNKRDQYKAERDELARKNKILEQEKKKYEERNKKGFECVVYCSHCQTVYGAIVPNGASLHVSGCAKCGVQNSGYLVSRCEVNKF